MYEKIESQTDVDQLLEISQTQAVLILKHSTSCPISANAYKAFTAYIAENEAQIQEKQLHLALVKVIEDRPASLYFAERVNVVHKSPQILLIKQGKALWDDSHWQVTKEAIKKQVAKL